MSQTEIRLIRANNPSPLTGTGTNSWILGRDAVVVVDPGPDSDDHLEALLQATRGERITHILVTHAHLDHSALVPRLQARTGAEVLAFGTAASGLSPLMARLAAEGMASGEGADQVFVPDRTLADGEILTTDRLRIEALHLPGHMGCHMGFALGDVLLSGDHVMGWSTSLVSPPDGDMGDYMASLARLQSREWSRFLPGHGPEIPDPALRLAELVSHRRAREAAILRALREGGPGNALDLAKRVYLDTPAALIPAAARNVLAHLIDLMSRDLCLARGGALAQAEFAAL